jgi:hypothetical protein
VKFVGVDRTLTIYHAKDSAPTGESLQMINVGLVEPEPIEAEGKTARLRWDKDSTLVLYGSVTASKGGEVKVRKAAILTGPRFKTLFRLNQ